jgi:hypothetical protein
MSRFEQLKAITNSFEQEFDKFYEKGNHAAGTRVRMGMQDIKKICQEIRIEIIKKKKTK